MSEPNNSALTAVVADIERSSPHDGPGMRTVVFLKGCPLRCEWCHNPECINPEPETLFYPEKCVHCGQCEKGCYSGARVICGREMSVNEVLAEVLRDKNYYGKDGGLTISGGEPLLRAGFTKALAKAAKASGVSPAVETSLFLWDEETLRSFDLIMFDLKLIDPEKHRKFTGVPLEPILDNIKRCAALGIPLIARTPVIPGVNDSEIPGIAGFLRKIPAVRRYELLPYHPLGTSKAEALGKTQTRFEIPSVRMMEELDKYAFIR